MGLRDEHYSKKSRFLLWLVHNFNSLEIYVRLINMGICKKKARGFCKVYQEFLGEKLGRALSYFIKPRRGG